MLANHRAIYLLALVALMGCAPTGAAVPAAGTGPADAASGPAQKKTLTLAVLEPIRAMGPWETSAKGGTGPTQELHTSALVTSDPSGGIEPRLLSQLPSLQDGTMVLLPGGRMQTTWKLRPNARWHDGNPITADDLAFTFQVYREPGVPFASSGTAASIKSIESVEAVDATTAVATWKTTYYRPFDLGVRQFWPLPRHILGAALDGDKTAFSNLPHWSTEYVSTGPFRLVDFGLGENLVFQRFDDYFLGRPKIDTIVVRVIGDPNAIFANLQAGTVDIAAHGVLPMDLLIRVRDEWKERGLGTIVVAPGSFRFFVVQFHPQWVQPIELSRDARIRQGLLTAVDRDELRNVMLPGIPGTESDSFLPSHDPRSSVVGTPFARYAYNRSAALQLLNDGGWHQAPDGRMLNSANERVQLAIRSQPGNRQDAAIYAQYLREIGIDVDEQWVSPELAQDREYNSTFSGISGHAFDGREGVIERLQSGAWALQENRYVGANTGHYGNPTLDSLTARLYATADADAQGTVLKAIGETMAADLPLMPSYYTATMGAVRSGVRALDDFAGISALGWMSRNAHLWDRDS